MKLVKKVYQGFYGVYAFVRLTINPERLDDVFVLSDQMIDPVYLDSLVEKFSKLPAGDRILKERPRLGQIDLQALHALPAGTLGHEFASQMIERGLKPEAIPTKDSEDAAQFVRAHLYETHDLWHTVTGFGTDVAGELGLQAFYLAQFQSKLAAAILAVGLLNTAIFARGETEKRMESIVRGWQLGRQARPFFGVEWRQRWAQPLTEIRRELAVAE